MKWFKFYGQDYLSDPKVLALSACERSCWLTLLSYGSANDNGMITFLDEQQLMAQSGISPINEEWACTLGVLKKLENLKMITLDNDVITILNWNKRQETSLTAYERVKRHREKKKNDNAMITTDKNRIEENRIDKKINNTVAFAPPTLEEVTKYIQERNNGVNADKWFNFYTAKGWMVGRNKMKDWKAAVRTWERDDKKEDMSVLR